MASSDRSTLGAMESLLREHGPFLRRLARGLVRDEHVAEDLVHDTWLAALRRRFPDGTSRSALLGISVILPEAECQGTAAPQAFEHHADTSRPPASRPSTMAPT